MNTISNTPLSLFDGDQIGVDYTAMQPVETYPTSTNSLVDLLHDGFYIVFLLKITMSL